jgi:hypothetical protein
VGIFDFQRHQFLLARLHIQQRGLELGIFRQQLAALFRPAKILAIAAREPLNSCTRTVSSISSK